MDDTTFTACPLSSVFGAEQSAFHDLRPSLRAWAGVWDVSEGDAIQTSEHLAILMVHLGGPPLQSQLGLEGEMQEVTEGGSMTVPSGAPFRLSIKGDTKLLGLVFDEALIRMSVIPLMARAPGHYELKSARVPPPSAVAALSAVLADELSAPPPVRTSCRASLIITLIEFLAADPRFTYKGAGTTNALNSQIERVITLIEENISLELPLEWLAGEAGISAYHLSRNFRRAMGIGVPEFTKKKRLETACRLLAETRKPLAEIAYDCGFSSQSRMNSVFRQLMDTTPLAYRKLCWKLTDDDDEE